MVAGRVYPESTVIWESAAKGFIVLEYPSAGTGGLSESLSNSCSKTKLRQEFDRQPPVHTASGKSSFGKVPIGGELRYTP